MKVAGMLAVSALLVGIATAAPAAEPAATAPPSLAAFDEDVAVCRRVVRQYCAIAQKIASSATTDSEQQAEGLRLLADARGKWADIQSRYASDPPAEYAGDKAFGARLRDFSNALEDMERALAAGDARRSFQACGFGCGMFVSMHEANGFDYALDKLFHLRKDIKTTAAAMKTRGMDAVRVRLPGLLQKRDVVLMAPPPFPSDHEKASAYSAAVDELSRAIDRLALAVAAGDEKQVGEILANGLALVNKPYGIAL